jgi:FemAB-related protein (PEP-CTERM system-associated)
VTQIDISSLATQDSETWNRFVATTPGGTFYHLHEWSRINRDGLGHETFLLRATRAGELVGVLPLTLVSSLPFGRILCSMPFVNYCGPCASADDAQVALLDAARTLAQSKSVRYLELRSAAALQTDMTEATHKISMTIELADDPEVQWNAFSSKHRTNIRRSAKNELTVRSGGAELLDVFYDVMHESWHNLGTPLYRRRYFKLILDTFPDQTRLFVCYCRDKPVAVAMNGYFNGTVEGMWAGGTAAARGLQANYVLYWEMIQDACKRGFKRYHLGRSTADSGAEDFKKKWNAQALQLHWYSYRPDGAPPAALNVDNPKFKLAIATWKRLPLWLTRVLGPTVAGGIP